MEVGANRARLISLISALAQTASACKHLLAAAMCVCVCAILVVCVCVCVCECVMGHVLACLTLTLISL